MDSDSKNASPFSKLEFEFGIDVLKHYILLSFRPHDYCTGKQMIIVYLPLLLLCIPFFTIFSKEIISGSSFEGIGLVLLLVVLFFTLVSVWGVVYGVVLRFGMHIPCWKSRRWKSRIELIYMNLHNGTTSKPINGGVAGMGKVSLEHFIIYQNYGIGDSLISFVYGKITKGFEPVWFDFIPGLLPRYPKPTGKPIEPVTFHAEFYEDRIIKGSHGKIFVSDWSDILDVIEDKRYPNLAIIRKKDSLEELVVKTDALEGASWEEIKERIAEASGNVSLKKELVKLKDDLRARRK